MQLMYFQDQDLICDDSFEQLNEKDNFWKKVIAAYPYLHNDPQQFHPFVKSL